MKIFAILCLTLAIFLLGFVCGVLTRTFRVAGRRVRDSLT